MTVVVVNGAEAVVIEIRTTAGGNDENNYQETGPIIKWLYEEENVSLPNLDAFFVLFKVSVLVSRVENVKTSNTVNIRC